MNGSSRRAVLRASGTACLAALAGCTGGSEESTDDEMPTDGETGTTEGDGEAAGVGARNSTATEGWSTFQSNLANTGHTTEAAPTDGVKTRWTYRIDGRVASPIVSDGTVFVGSEGMFTAIDASSGESEWEFEFDEESAAIRTPTVADGTVFFTTSDSAFVDGQLYALDAESGEQRWQFETRNGPGDVRYYDGRVFVTSRRGLSCLDGETGAVHWRHEADLRGAIPAIVDGTVYLNHETAIMAFDAETGSVERHDFDLNVGSPAVADGVLYVSAYPGSSGLIYGIDLDSFERTFTQETEEQLYMPAVAGDSVFVSSYEGTMYRIDRRSGGVRWRFDTGKRSYWPPLVADGTVYFGNETAAIYAIDAAAGTETWRYETDGWVTSPLAVSDGTVFATDRTGMIYALAEA